jgi:hypothetical protein
MEIHISSMGWLYMKRAVECFIVSNMVLGHILSPPGILRIGLKDIDTPGCSFPIGTHECTLSLIMYTLLVVEVCIIH